MATKFLILNLDDQIFTPMIDYIYYKNRGANAARPGKRKFSLVAPNNVVRQLLWVSADDAARPANDLFDQMLTSNFGEVLVSNTHNNVLAGLGANDQIYISVHGQYVGSTDKATNRILLDCAAARGTYDATAFADFLENTLGLPTNQPLHLKIFACYSAKGRGDLKALNTTGSYDEQHLKGLVQGSFAGLLKAAMKARYPQLTVSGYVGATRLPSAFGQHKRAFGKGHTGHKSAARDFRITFDAGSDDPTLPAGWQNWVTWL